MCCKKADPKGFYQVLKTCLDSVKDSSYNLFFFRFEGTIKGQYRGKSVEAGNSHIFCEYTTGEIKEPFDYVIRMPIEKENVVKEASSRILKVKEYMYKDNDGFAVYVFSRWKEFNKENIEQVLEQLYSLSEQ